MPKNLFNYRLLPLFLALSAGAVAAACKSSAGSNTQSAQPAPAASSSASTPSAPIPAAWLTAETTPVNLSNYTLINVPTNGFEQYMIPGSAAQGVPASLQGIWWMQGNPLAHGNATTFSQTLWDFPNHRMLVQQYGANNYTLNADLSGMMSFLQSAVSNMGFEVQFNSDYTHGQLVQESQVGHTSLVLRVPVAALNYQMDLVSDGDWVRSSWVGLIRVQDYHLLRIVDAQGNRVEPNYTNFLASAPANSYIPELKPYVPQNGSGSVLSVDPTFGL